MTTKRKGPGRPPRLNKAATDRIEIRVTPAERKVWQQAASDAGCETISDAIRLAMTRLGGTS